MIVQTVLMEMDFNKTKDELIENVFVNNSATKENVAEIERTIRKFKERNLCTVYHFYI